MSRSWWTLLGPAKAAGAGVTVARARWYSRIPYPLVYAAPVIGALVLGAAV